MPVIRARTNALSPEIERRPRDVANLSTSAFQALVILEGADEPLAVHVIAERVLLSGASMTSLLDTVERRVWSNVTDIPPTGARS